MLEIDEQVDQTLKRQFIPAKQQSLDIKGSIDNIPESQQTDTGHFCRRRHPCSDPRWAK